MSGICFLCGKIIDPEPAHVLGEIPLERFSRLGAMAFAHLVREHPAEASGRINSVMGVTAVYASTLYLALAAGGDELRHQAKLQLIAMFDGLYYSELEKTLLVREAEYSDPPQPGKGPKCVDS